MTFYELEKICKARKRRFYFFIFLMILLVFGMVGYVLFNLYGAKNEPIIKKIEKKEVNKTIKSNVVKEKTTINKEEVKKEVKKLNFILPSFAEIEQKEKIKSKKNIIKTSNKEKNTSKVLIADNIPSFETCINLAKIYLKNKDYKNALKWAKFANLQNKEDPLSWIISAKALYALGKKEKAIKLLEIYNSYSKNKEVEKLIKEFNEK